MTVYQHHTDVLKSHIRFVQYALSPIWFGAPSFSFEANILQNRFPEGKGKVEDLVQNIRYWSVWL